MARKVVQKTTYSIVTLLAVIVVFVIAGYYLLQNGKLASTLGGTSKFAVNPSSVNVTTGNTFEVEIRADTANKVNTLISILKFPSDLLEATSVSVAGSYYQKISEPVKQPTLVRLDMYYNNPILDNTGMPIGNVPPEVGNHLVAKVTFKAKAAGTATLSFDENNSAMVEYGTANSVLGPSQSATVTISNPVSPTPPPATPPATPPSSGTKPSTGSGSTAKPSTGTSGATSSTGTSSGTGGTSTGSEATPTGGEEAAALSDVGAPRIPLTLTILDDQGRPVKGADVEVDGAKAVTADNGVASFAGIKAGTYKVVVKNKGVTQEYDVTIDPNATEAKQTLQLVAAANSPQLPFLPISLAAIALAGVAILYIFGHRFLEHPHLAAEMVTADSVSPVTTESSSFTSSSSGSESKKSESKDDKIDALASINKIENETLTPGSIVHPEKYSEHSIHHPDNKSDDEPVDHPLGSSSEDSKDA